MNTHLEKNILICIDSFDRLEPKNFLGYGRYEYDINMKDN